MRVKKKNANPKERNMQSSSTNTFFPRIQFTIRASWTPPPAPAVLARQNKQRKLKSQNLVWSKASVLATIIIILIANI